MENLFLKSKNQIVQTDYCNIINKGTFYYFSSIGPSEQVIL